MNCSSKPIDFFGVKEKLNKRPMDHNAHNFLGNAVQVISWITIYTI